MQPRSFALIVVLVSIVRARSSALPEANAFWKKENAALLKMPLESGEMKPGEKQVGTETAMEKLTKQETKTKDKIKKLEKEKDVLEKKKEALEEKSDSKGKLQKVEKEIEKEDKDEIEKLKKLEDILEKEKDSKAKLQRKVEKEIEKEDEMEKKLGKEIKTIDQDLVKKTSVKVSAPVNDILTRLDHRNLVFVGVFVSVALLLFLRARKQAQEDSVHSALLNSTEQEI